MTSANRPEAQRQPACFGAILWVGLLASSVGVHAGVTDSYAPNKTFISVDTSALYLKLTEAVLDRRDASDTAVASTPGDVGYRNTVAESSSLLPFSGDTKDGVISNGAVTFTGGSSGIADTFHFDFSGMVSNLSSRVDVDTPVPLARAAVVGSFMFFLDASFGGAAPGTVVGQLTLPALRVAAPYEQFSLTLLDNGTTSHTVMPGDAGSTVDLRLDHAYALSLKYTMTVPLGIDPPFELNVGGSISAVPEPKAGWLWLAGLGLLGTVLPRRQPTAH